MNSFWSVLQNGYHKIVNSIAFFPVLISLAGLGLSVFIVQVEYDSFTIELKNRISFLLITNREEAQLVLGTLVASIISLMVFSFSMVMVVLGRASSNLSPRVLPGLISNKTHQFVLGLYLGTILYSLIMIINFQAEGDYRIPSLGVLVSMILGIACLSLFIYFIHSISQNIQVENILNQIYKRTVKALGEAEANDAQDPGEIPATASWQSVYTNHAGYIVKYNSDALVSIARRNNLQIAIARNGAFFFVKGYPFLKVRAHGELSEELSREIRRNFIFSITDNMSDHYQFGFRQISEIAVKALSPGINDPGTAMKGLDHLLLLFTKKVNCNEELFRKDNSGTIRLIHATTSLRELVFRNLVPIREFGKKDALVILKLLTVLKNLIFISKDKRQHMATLLDIARSCIESADKFIDNPIDRDEINSVVTNINSYIPADSALRYLH